MSKASKTIIGFIANTVAMSLVAGIALALLLYVGHGEASRTLNQLQIEKLTSQGRQLQAVLNDFLQPGHPVRQFVGFKAKTSSILESDPSINRIAVFDNKGERVFMNGNAEGAPANPDIAVSPQFDAGINVRSDQTSVQVSLPLNNRFESAGFITITTDRTAVADRVDAAFAPIKTTAIIAAIIFGFSATVLGFGATKRKRHAQLIFAACFISVSGLVVTALVTLYADAAEAKSKSMADTLGQRLSSIVAFGLDIWEIDGIDDLLQDYKAHNPDLAHATIVVDGVVRFHTNKYAIGEEWSPNPKHYEYISDMTQPGGRDIKLAVAIPSDIVMRQSIRSVKNFAALFIASALMASVFLQIAGSMGRPHQAPRGSPRPARAEPDDVALLSLIKPVFFIAVAAEHLSYAFLPQYITSLADEVGLSSDYASAPFTIYYLLFALSLLPASQLSQRFGAKPLMFWGLIASGLGLSALALAPDFTMICLARSLSGLGQGILFIGVQSYILEVASPERKTRGAAIIVFGFQGGMIAGMAIGSLLVTHIGQANLFNIAACVAFVMAAYTLIVVPRKRAIAGSTPKAASPKLMARDLGAVFKDLEFLRTMLLVGIPTKAVLTGVVIFAVPLMLASGGFPQEDIGQILMIYAASVLISSGYISGFVDRSKRTEDVLLIGSFISAASLIAIGVFGPSGAASNGGAHGEFATVAIIVAVAALGMAHGLINAPVVTHVASAKVAQRYGAGPVTAAYRFLERIGHVAGPMIAGQLIASGVPAGKSIAWIGVGILFMAALFALRPSSDVSDYAASGS